METSDYRREVAGSPTLVADLGTVKQCTVYTCGNSVYARGMCQKHYRRTMNYGNPLIVHKRNGGWREYKKVTQVA